MSLVYFWMFAAATLAIIVWLIGGSL